MKTPVPEVMVRFWPAATVSPPLAAIAPETVSDVSVPTDVNDDVTTVEFNVVPVSVPAAAVTVMLVDPSKAVPLMVLPGLKVEADVALPLNAPEKVVAVTVPVLGL